MKDPVILGVVTVLAAGALTVAACLSGGVSVRATGTGPAPAWVDDPAAVGPSVATVGVGGLRVDLRYLAARPATPTPGAADGDDALTTVGDAFDHVTGLLHGQATAVLELRPGP